MRFLARLSNEALLYSTTSHCQAHVLRGLLKVSQNRENKKPEVNLHALFPADPKVPPRQEAGDSVPSKVMDPAFLAQLGHNRVNPREPRLCLQQKRNISPPAQSFITLLSCAPL